MNKKIYIPILAVLFFASPCFAQKNDFFKDILISEDVKTKTNAEIGKSDAGKLLDQAPKKIEIEGIKAPVRREKKVISEDDLKKYGEAPFGLNWGTTNQYVKSNNGVLLTDISDKDTVRNFSATMLPKSIPNFDNYILNFGYENQLWNIVAHGKTFDDDKHGTKVLEEYEKFAKLLGQKYKTKKEMFTPKVSIVEEVKKLPNGKEEVLKKEIKSEIGDETFIEDIKKGEASLLSTFTDGKVGIVLTINVDKDGKTYITVEYKSIKIIKEREQKTLEAI